MKLKNWICIPAALVMIASCGENSTNETTTTTDSTASATAENTPSSTPKVDPPQSTKSHFETKYPGATNVTWTYYNEPYTAVEWDWTAWPVLDQQDYLVRYTWDGSEYYGWYDQDGNWIGAVTTIADQNGLPAAVNSTVKKEFAGYTITKIDKEVDKNREAYELKLEKGDDKARALIATDGTLLKKKGAEGKEKVDVK